MATDYQDSLTELEKIKANNEAALNHLYVKNYNSVERYIITNSGTKDDAKDIFQEAFMATWRNVQLEKYQAKQESGLDQYLFQIAKFKWLDVLRKRKRIQEGEMPENYQLPAEEIEKDSETERRINTITAYFKDMKQPCKELLQKFYYQKQSIRVIATHYSWTEATAKNNKYRCLEKLRKTVLTHHPTSY